MAVVIDPIQSVRGKVVIDAFRLINPLMGMSGHEPRQTTSVNGHLNKPSIEAMYKGLNKYYYSINIVPPIIAFSSPTSVATEPIAIFYNRHII